MFQTRYIKTAYNNAATAANYAHLAPEHLRMAVSRLEGLTSAQRAGDSTQDSTQEPTELVGVSQNSSKELAPRAGLEPATS